MLNRYIDFVGLFDADDVQAKHANALRSASFCKYLFVIKMS